MFASVALVGLASACAVDAAATDEQTGLDAEAACANPEGTNAMIAAVAVAVADELGRWKVGTDFKLQIGTYNQQHMVLTQAGLDRCAANGRPGCPITKALLFYQDAKYDGKWKFADGTVLSAWSYASRLVAGYGAQKTCEDRAVLNPKDPNACAAEEHKLTFLGNVQGTCALDYNFQARSPSGAPLARPDLLKNKLIWAGHPQNPYIAFKSTPDTVTVDPFWESTDDGSSGATCVNACSKPSMTSLVGKCCKCSGVQRTFVSTPNANVYACGSF